MSAGPDPSTLALERATALCQLGRFEDAGRTVSDLLASEPQNSRAWCLLAQAQLGLRQFDKAFESASRAAALAPNDDWPQRLLSMAARKRGDSRRGVTHAEEAVRLAPHEWRTHVQLAAARSNDGDNTGAIAAANRAAQLAPNEPGVHLVAGAVAQKAGDRNAAAQAFERTLALDPNSSAALDGLARAKVHRTGIANINAGKLASAAGGFAAALRSDPRSAASRRALDYVLRLFLRLLAYFIFLDAWIGDIARDSGSSAARIIPLILLAAPLGYAGWFVLRLPRTLRPYLFRAAFAGRTALATTLELVAIAAVIGTAVAAHGARGAFVAVALIAALVARLILYTAPRAN